MYTVNKGPSKLVAKTRGGLSQTFDKIETIREISRPMENGRNGENDISVAKPVFQQYRRTYSNRSHTESRQNGQLYSSQYQQLDEPLSPQYEDMVKYIRDSWDLVVAQNPYDQNGTDGTALSSASSTITTTTTTVTKTVATATATTTTTTANATNNVTETNKDSNNNSGTASLHSLIPPVSSTTKVFYHNDPPSPILKDFGAFDLESWWGRRLFNNITKSL